MARDRAREFIEDYLDRVRAYLPLGSEDYIIEIRTHLLQEAERISNGAVTEGSALLAIEHMGDPKSVANEYAGTGKRIGPLPVEYARPVAALTIVFIGIGLAVMLGLFLVEPVLPGVTSVFSASALFLALVLASIVTALVVTERLNILDMRRTEAERTSNHCGIVDSTSSSDPVHVCVLAFRTSPDRSESVWISGRPIVLPSW
ncbi:MAG: hypothetical protein ACTSPE_02860 [Candidatus Thorarchaeota archaeon]